MELMKFPHHTIFIEQAEFTLQNYLIFELQTKNNQMLYLKHPIFKYPSDEVKLVFVQAENFLTMWRNIQYPQEPQLS